MILLIIVLLVFLVAYSTGKKKYADHVKAVTKEDTPLKSILPAGFSLLEWVKYPYRSAFDRKVRRQLAEIKEPEYVEFYLRVRWASAAAGLLLGLLLACLLLLGGGEPVFFALGVLVSALLAWLPFAKLEQEIKERHQSIVMDLPDFTNKLLILSGAGLSLQAAMIKISKEMQKDTPFYRALASSVYLLEHGSTAEESFDRLTTVCNTPEVRRMSSVLLQNLHRGGTDVLLALKEIGKELWEARRAAAKKKAAEAETMLLLPMMLMFIAVIVMVAVPAIMGINV